jgi:hypothetical protein
MTDVQMKLIALFTRHGDKTSKLRMRRVEFKLSFDIFDEVLR